MARYICKILGARGRALTVYDTKCVIATSVTAGSILTGNATDGEKTIFYLDCTGVQYKDCGMTLGYLQLETPSMQMNNQTSNFFSENTFTFEDKADGIGSQEMRLFRSILCDLIELHKYYAPVSREMIYPLILRIDALGIQVDVDFLAEARRANKARLERESQAAQAEEQRRLEQNLQHRQTLLEEARKQCSEIGLDEMLSGFLAQAAACQKSSEILSLWNDQPLSALELDFVGQLQEAIDRHYRYEQVYGASERRVQELKARLNEIANSRNPE